MDDYSKEVLYNCLTYLIDGINKDVNSKVIKNNIFEKLSNIFPKKDYDETIYNFAYIYITSVLLNNRAFFNNRFDKLPWNLPLSDFSNESTLDAFSLPFLDDAAKNNDDDYDRDYNDYSYIDNIEKIRHGHGKLYDELLCYDDKESKYNPDTLELINLEYDKENPEDYSDYEDLDYDILPLLPEILLDVNGLNVNNIIKCIRDALAHNCYNFTNTGLCIYKKNYKTGGIEFECNIAFEDMDRILAEYIKLIMPDSHIDKIYTIMSILFRDELDYVSNYFIETLDELLMNNFKYLGLEDDYSKIKIKVENEINNNRSYYLEDYDKEDYEDYSNPEEVYLEYYVKLLTIRYVKEYFKENLKKIFPSYKMCEIYCILKDFNNLMYSDDWPSYDKYKRDFIPFDYTYDVIEDNIYDIDISNINISLIAKLNVLLNLLFVQSSYENVNKEQIDLSMMKINKEYVDDLQKRNGPTYKRLLSSKRKLEKGIKGLEESIEIDRLNGINNTNKEKGLYEQKEKLDDLNNTISEFLSSWYQCGVLDNESILMHIRNAFAHGSYHIDFIENDSDLKSIYLNIEDYETNSGNLSFSGKISIYDLLNSVLKKDIVDQLFGSNSKKR